MRSSGVFPMRFPRQLSGDRAAQTRMMLMNCWLLMRKSGSPRSFGRSSILDRECYLLSGRAVSLPSL